jgi:hypothetical protein
MILVARPYYDTWSNEEGQVLRCSTSWSSLPLVRLVVEYDPNNASVRRVLPWTAEAHETFFGRSVRFQEDPTKYKQASREFNIYLKYLNPLPAGYTRARNHRGEIDPAVLMATKQTSSEDVREARILYVIRNAQRFRHNHWVPEADIGEILTSDLQPTLEVLLMDDIIRRTANNLITITVPNLPSPDVPPLVPLPELLRKECCYRDDVKLMDPEKRRILVVSATGNISLRPKGKHIIRFLRKQGLYTIGDVATMQSRGPTQYLITGEKGEISVDTQFVNGYTNMAASATYTDLPLINENCGYSMVVIVGESIQDRYLRECIRIMGGQTDSVVVYRQWAPARKPPTVREKRAKVLDEEAVEASSSEDDEEDVSD